MAFEIDEEKIRQAIAVLKPDGKLFEVRMIKDKWNSAGYFRSADALIDALKRAKIHTQANIYITLNSLNDACYDREAKDHFVEYMKPTASDNDITWYDWLMVDVDPIRPAGTSSSNDQVQKSRETARKIFRYLKSRGWNDPIVAMSGNGTHLLYSISMDVSQERQNLARDVLKTLNMLFRDNEMDVDMKTFNPARVCKLYGTMARKGANSKDRPHRMSQILWMPDEIIPTPMAYLQALVDSVPKPEQPQKYNSYNPNQFDLQKWIDDHGIEVTEKTTWAGGTKWILDHCPFNDQHNNKDAAIVQTTDGKICYNCFHNSCADKKWKDFRLFYEPEAYQNKDESPAPDYAGNQPAGWTRRQESEDGEDGPVFRTTEEIRNRPSPPEEFIETGIGGIDSKMKGLKKTFVTVLSGLRSAGKSSILSQLILNCRERGMKTAIFSGEMMDKQVLKWLTLQAAGKSHVHSTKYDGIYYPNEKPSELISKWLDGYVYVYNNDYGAKYSWLIASLRDIITEKQIDLVLIDNMMAMNLEELDRDVWSGQKKFIQALQKLARDTNVHILLVAHPRKTLGYLRMDDICGSSDIPNTADNVFIIHRVNDDYKAKTKEFFRWTDSNPIYKAGNVIEICKDRDNGHMDVHIPLYFERETKRLKNSESEYIHYGWEIDQQSGMEIAAEAAPWEEVANV